ncbi:hypothetical protein [Actinoplanes sp. NPDC026619]|uniref:hypothetical protein n=1 Tax=Actinoplanes sp. NPDC026619 TaxID=3155798 RepID=UPI0033E8CD99
MTAADELADAIGERQHWELDGLDAIYRPHGVTAHVRIRPVRAPTRPRDRYLVSTIEGEIAVHSTPMPTAVAAIAWAERRKLS